MNGYELRNLAETCEHEIRKKFLSLADNRYHEERMYTYAGIVLADSIIGVGGLYLALAVTLSRYYEAKDKMNSIDSFLEKYSYIEDKRLDEIDNVALILREFNDIYSTNSLIS